LPSSRISNFVTCVTNRRGCDAQHPEFAHAGYVLLPAQQFGELIALTDQAVLGIERSIARWIISRAEQLFHV
jgi:hypothetical protein